MSQQTTQPITIFYSYARQDKQLRDKLEMHLSSMKKDGLITAYHDRDIKPGAERLTEINNYLQTSDIILLLVSPNFMASNYCDTKEVDIALQRHENGEAWVIPILLRSVDWEYSSIGKLQPLPREEKPVAEWSSRDRAFFYITKDLRSLITELHREKNNLPDTKEDENDASRTPPVSKTQPRKKRRDLYKAIRAGEGEKTIGQKLQDIVRPVRNSFSRKEIKKRSKGLSLLLLFIFGFLDVFVLPPLVFKWTANSLALIGAFLFTIILFMMGIMSKNNTVALSITFVYCIAWTGIGYLYIDNAYNLKMPFLTVLLIGGLVSFAQLLLFRKRQRKGLPFFPRG